jgi:hypothetical protein
LVAGTYAVTASYQGNLSFTGSTSSAVNLSVVDFKVAAAGGISASAGQSGNTTLTITSLATGFSPSVTLSCSGAPSEATCSLSPATVTANGAGVTSTLTVTTTAPHAQIKHIANVESPKGPLYALLIPGLFGVVGLVSNRKRGLSRLRAIGLIMVLAVSTLWLTSCGGGSNTPSDPGTPAGTYTITVTATTSSPAITHSQAVILTVN